MWIANIDAGLKRLIYSEIELWLWAVESMLELVNADEKPLTRCSKCNMMYDEPKLIQYYACPHCESKIEEKPKTGCQFWYGYLNQREKGESMPPQCVECEKVLDCMLSELHTSPSAVAAIKKWY